MPDELDAEQGRTETVVVLFTDLVDSTDTAMRLERVAADTFRRRHFSLLRDAIGASGGWEVKNLGDGLMVAFTTCSAAVACAVAMQQAVERESVVTGIDVGLRVGLSVGEATREADDFFGEPVIEAARLCSAALAGQIVAGRLVASMVGRRSGREFASIGPLTLKGLVEPFDAVEVRWEPLPRADTSGIVPLPDGLARRVVRTFVGRVPELEAIMDEFKLVADGGGRRVVFVAGEPGIGKTSLAATVAMQLDAADACVLFGHCDEQALIAYQPFVEALDHYVSHGPPDIVQNNLDTYGSSLTGVAPCLRRRAAGIPPALSTDAETSRYLLFGSVSRLLSDAAERQPVVVILDDLQWADDASLHLLRHLVDSLEPARVFVLGIYRDAELAHGHPLSDVIGVLHRTGAFRRISLHGLGDDEIAELVAASAGHELGRDGIALAHSLRDETEGNPFFVREILRHLSEIGGIYQDETGRWLAADDLEAAGLPQSIREVIAARVARLGTRCEQALEAAAVIGREFDLAVLQALLGVDEATLLDMLDSATTAALIREVPGRAEQYRFSHVLIQHTLYDALSTSRRARLHGRVAEVIESVPGPSPASRVSELARHWRASIRPVNVDKALRYARLAAEAAMANLAPQDACEYYQQALDLHAELTEPDPLERIDLLVGLGTAQRLSGDGAFRVTLMDAAQHASSRGDASRLVAAVLAADHGFYTSIGRIEPERVAMVHAALDGIGSRDSVERARLLAILAIELTWGGSIDERADLARQAVTMAKRVGDAPTIVRVANLACFSIQVPDTLEQRLDYSGDALEHALALGDPKLIHWAAATRSIAAVQACLTSEIDPDFEMMTSSAEQLDEPAMLWHAKFRLASRALIAGDPGRAEALAVEARDFGLARGQPDAAVIFAPQISSTRFQQGRMGELVPLLSDTVAHVAGMPVFIAVLALAHSETDEHDHAHRLLTDAMTRGFSALPRDSTWMSGLACWSVVAAECHDPKAAAELIGLMRPFARQNCYDRAAYAGFVSHYLGLLSTTLGHYSEAESYFAAATDDAARLDARWDAARSALGWARLCLARRAPDDDERARVLLTTASALAASNGYATIARRAAQTLDRRTA